MAAPNIKSSTTLTSVFRKSTGYAVNSTLAAALSNATGSGKRQSFRAQASSDSALELVISYEGIS
jgi:hypothetical protein